MPIGIILILLASAPGSFGPGGRFQLEHSKDGFGVRSHGVVENLAGGRTRFYPLPQSTFARFVHLRPEAAHNPSIPPSAFERQEVIGPHQIAEGKLWFGNNYYDGEGNRGVGAFGYFDPVTRRYTLFSPPAVADCEISAILVEADSVWLALDRFGEDISTSPCGLVRWDRETHATHRYPLEFVIDRIRRNGAALRFSTRYGYAFFNDGEVRRFLANGKPVKKFPPPPSHY